jgi:hypothetical protein
LKPKLYYNNTIYPKDREDIHLISDVNPLLFQRYPTSQILIICAREGQVIRLRKLLIDKYAHCPYLCLGWWDLFALDLTKAPDVIDTQVLCTYDVVVILDKERIDERFSSLFQQVIKSCV